MNLRLVLTALVAVSLLSAANAAPLWHSVVLDDFGTNILTNVEASGTATAAGLPDVGGTSTSDSITGRRDLAIFRDASIGGAADFARSNVTGNSFSFNVANSLNAFAWIQNDYGTPYGNTSSNTLASELNLTGAAPIDPLSTSEIASAYVIDVTSATAGIDVTFSVWGATDNDFATATVQTTAGGAEELRFDLVDFTDKNGLFATNVSAGKGSFTWSSVTGYSIQLSTGSGTFTGGFEASEVFATIPEPGSMLAMAGLFGGAGLVGFRRKRAAKKAAKA